jgi:hypothetical protein
VGLAAITPAADAVVSGLVPALRVRAVVMRRERARRRRRRQTRAAAHNTGLPILLTGVVSSPPTQHEPEVFR